MSCVQNAAAILKWWLSSRLELTRVEDEDEEEDEDEKEEEEEGEY